MKMVPKSCPFMTRGCLDIILDAGSRLLCHDLIGILLH
ncbi:MAG: hypothetical protein HNEKOMLI_00512 [Sodalis sp. Psp]|nr:hypothetical protein [Sodalis sp. Psp]MCR3756984.1 hypothetical protein [Sodalis sp. Ppy]